MQPCDSVNIEEIMTKIRENVQLKKELGIYSDDDIQEIYNLSLEIPSAMVPTGSGLLDQALFLQKNYDFRRDYNISSHRPLLGKIIVPLRRFFISAILKISSPVLDKNISYNFHVVQLLNSLIEEVESLKKECAELRRLLETAKRS